MSRYKTTKDFTNSNLTNPMSQEVFKKFHVLAGRAFASNRLGMIVRVFDEMEKMNDVAKIG